MTVWSGESVGELMPSGCPGDLPLEAVRVRHVADAALGPVLRLQHHRAAKLDGPLDDGIDLVGRLHIVREAESRITGTLRRGLRERSQPIAREQREPRPFELEEDRSVTALRSGDPTHSLIERARSREIGDTKV